MICAFLNGNYILAWIEAKFICNLNSAPERKMNISYIQFGMELVPRSRDKGTWVYILLPNCTAAWTSEPEAVANQLASKAKLM